MKEYIERETNRKIIKMVDYEAMRAAFDAKFKETMKLIESGETHLDNLAEGFHEADGVIFRMPAADVVERKRGEWVWDDNAYDWGLGAWVCKGCHSRNDNIPAKKDTNPYMWVGSKYCPNCGADMRGDKHE